jgi:hypothetical protein
VAAAVGAIAICVPVGPVRVAVSAVGVAIGEAVLCGLLLDFYVALPVCAGKR